MTTSPMTLPEAIQTLKEHQAWRISGEGEMLHPKVISQAINLCIESAEEMASMVSE